MVPDNQIQNLMLHLQLKFACQIRHSVPNVLPEDEILADLMRQKLSSKLSQDVFHHVRGSLGAIGGGICGGRGFGEVFPVGLFVFGPHGGRTDSY